MSRHQISIPPNANPSRQPCVHTDIVFWKNDSGKQVTGFTLPACVTPTTSFDTLDIGASSPDYTIVPGSNGDYHYPFNVADATAVPRSGTINVGSGK
jgi:hypothetical protein